jgi:hypothetical protein
LTDDPQLSMLLGEDKRREAGIMCALVTAFVMSRSRAAFSALIAAE